MESPKSIKMIQINSFSELTVQLKDSEKAFLLLYKSGNENSDCAFAQVKEASQNISDMLVLAADVSVVRDIHPQYKIASVPTLIEFEKAQFKNVVKGCNQASHYKAIFEDAVFFASAKNEEKPKKRVTVYSTPSCSWCTTLKNHLRQHKIYFTDVDVSKDQQAAEAMVRRSGQQGVPQTDINGEMIVGFNKQRINQLLEIKG